MKGSAEGAKTMNETKPKTKIKKEFFFFRNGSVFELIAKCVVMLLIPYVLLILLGIILDRGLDVVAGSDFWPIAIFALICFLELVALVLSVIAVIKFCLKRRKPKAEREAAKMRRKAEKENRKAEAEKRKAEKAAEKIAAAEKAAEKIAAAEAAETPAEAPVEITAKEAPDKEDNKQGEEDQC